jgi:hypothetical protein
MPRFGSCETGWAGGRRRGNDEHSKAPLQDLLLFSRRDEGRRGRISRQIANAVLAVEIFVAQGPGQRDRVAGAQFRTLDDRRRVDLAVSSNTSAPSPVARPSISMARVRLVRAGRWATRLRSAQSRQKRLIGAKSADLASQSGRNWLSAGGHSRFWLITSALKDKGCLSPAFYLPEFQSDQLKRMPRAGSRSR